MVSSGDLGTVYLARLAGHDPAPPPEAYIPGSGGLFRDFSVHDFDIIRWLLGTEVQEVYADGVSVTCVSPSQVVPTPGTVFHHLVDSMDDPKGEPVHLMAQAALLLTTEPLERVSGRVTYSQQVLDEFGWMPAGTAKGTGLPGQRRGSGYSEI